MYVQKKRTLTYLKLSFLVHDCLNIIKSPNKRIQILLCLILPNCLSGNEKKCPRNETLVLYQPPLVYRKRRKKFNTSGKSCQSQNCRIGGNQDSVCFLILEFHTICVRLLSWYYNTMVFIVKQWWYERFHGR